MPFYLIKANGRYYDEVYTERPKKTEELKKEFQALLKTDNVKVRRLPGKG
jgi:hypothetical protein